MKKDNTDIQIDRVYKEINKDEPDITHLLKKLSKKYGGKLSGLDKKLKKKTKIKVKIKLKKQKKQDYMKEPRDILRYTIVFDKDKYVYGVSHIYGELLDEKSFDTKNKWNKQMWCLGDLYQGINTSWKYKNGVIFELQFHTPESFAIKNERHHVYDMYLDKNCDSIHLNRKAHTTSKCEKARRHMLDKEKKIDIPDELDGSQCGTPLNDFKNILSKKKRKTKKKTRKKTKKKTRKTRRKTRKKK